VLAPSIGARVKSLRLERLGQKLADGRAARRRSLVLRQARDPAVDGGQHVGLHAHAQPEIGSDRAAGAGAEGGKLLHAGATGKAFLEFRENPVDRRETRLDEKRREPVRPCRQGVGGGGTGSETSMIGTFSIGTTGAPLALLKPVTVCMVRWTVVSFLSATLIFRSS
jgi:hypothetical protein